jgi:hypothetical protein
VIEAIAPAVRLEAVLNGWNHIAVALAEASRKRKPQV